MKKKLVIILVAIVIIGLVGFGIFFIADGRLKHYQMNNERIHNCTTLSKYIEYHDVHYMTVANNNNSAEYSLYFESQNIKCDLLKEKDILYYDMDIDDMGSGKGLLILNDNNLYETAFNSDKVYSNGQQYKQINTGIEIKQVKILLDSPYFISKDNKYYTFSNNELTELEIQNLPPYNFAKYTTLLKDETIKKVISFEGANVLVIKNDGQVYKQEYKYDDNGAVGTNKFSYSYTLTNEELILSNKEYGNITDCVYNQYDESKSGITRIVSDKGLFYFKQTKDQQYIDTEPTYEIVTSDIYNKYKSNIKFIDSNYVFTTDNNIIRTDMLCRDIDKEVK